MKTNRSKTLLQLFLFFLGILWALLFFLDKLFPSYIEGWQNALSDKAPLIAFLASVGGVLIGVLANILFDLIITRISGRIFAELAKALSELAENIQSFLASIARSLQGTINDQTNKFIEVTTKITASLTLFVSDVLVAIISIPPQIINNISGRLRHPKWYHQKGAIDPGLIEVSLAITAVIVAIPSIFESIPSSDLLIWLRFIGEAVSIFTSISLLNLYSRDKGANSHILISPFDSGPFFFLGWSIILGLVSIRKLN